MVEILRIRDRVLRSKQDIYLDSHRPSSVHTERGDKRNIRCNKWREVNAIFRFDVAFTPMKSQKLWLPAQDLQKGKTVKILAYMRYMISKPIPH